MHARLGNVIQDIALIPFMPLVVAWTSTTPFLGSQIGSSHLWYLQIVDTCINTRLTSLPNINGLSPWKR